MVENTMRGKGDEAKLYSLLWLKWGGGRGMSDYFEGFPDDTRNFTKASVLSNSVPIRGVFSQCGEQAWHHTFAIYVLVPVQMKGSCELLS